MFGKVIFISMNVAISICKYFFVYIPSLFAFTSAFHFFMYGDPIFRSYIDGCLKVIVMMIGEFDFEDHFEWYKVKEMGGRKFSVQVFSNLNPFQIPRIIPKLLFFSSCFFCFWSTEVLSS